MRKTLLASIMVSMIFVMSLCAFVYAAPLDGAPDIPSVNTIFTDENGEQQVVIRVNEDGSFVTQIMDEENELYVNQCSHKQLEANGPITSTSESYDAKYADKCYKTRTRQSARCAYCKMPGFVIYGLWSDKPHDYPFLGSTCEECGYKK